MRDKYRNFQTFLNLNTYGKDPKSQEVFQNIEDSKCRDGKLNFAWFYWISLEVDGVCLFITNSIDDIMKIIIPCVSMKFYHCEYEFPHHLSFNVEPIKYGDMFDMMQKKNYNFANFVRWCQGYIFFYNLNRPQPLSSFTCVPK